MPDALELIRADHAGEVSALDALLRGLADDDWLRPTPAAGWDIRDSVAHLAVGDEMALECVVEDRVPAGMREGMEAVAAGQHAAEAFETKLVRRGRDLSPAEVYRWWGETNAALRDALAGVDPSRRLPWGPNVMSPMSFITARLMETWAHGLDCFDAVDIPSTDTDRLRHVAHLGLRALPYAFMVAGLPAPGPVRLELTAPAGEPWSFGPDDAPTTITGAASDWCRVAVRRDRRGERERLSGTGPDAATVIEHVRAYL